MQHPAFSQVIDDGRLLCTLCPRACKLSDQQRGLCFVRKRQGSDIQLTTYGRSSGFVIDPIEKKPLNHFLPGSPVLSFGTAGCNLSCKFCQNWDMSKSRQMDTVQSPASPEQIAEAAALHACRSVAFTYNDPVIFYEYAVDTARACHEIDIRTVAVTAGYITEAAREAFFQHIDAANVDLKGFTDSFYRDLCGGELQAVLETLKYLVHETNVWVEITTLLIPGENDSEKELNDLTTWVAHELGQHIPLHFSAFHPDYRMLDHPPTSHQSLLNAKTIAERNGMQFVYLGNVRDSQNASTYCPACQQQLIYRSAYDIIEWKLDSGTCRKCGYRIPGIFESDPGNWGSRYQRIKL